MAGNAEQTAGRGRRPALEAGVERRLLLDAGLAVLRRSGYERATLDDVLAEAGLGTRAFYRHFSSKDELLCAIYRREADASVQRVTRRLAVAANPMDALTAWVDEILSIAFRSSRATRARILWVGGATTVVGYDAERERSMRMLAAPLVPVLEEGRRTGVFPDADPEADAETINAIAWSAMAGFTTATGPRLDRDRARAHVLRFVLRALGYDGAAGD
jgi:AcrR family transcriptional regulator